MVTMTQIWFIAAAVLILAELLVTTFFITFEGFLFDVIVFFAFTFVFLVDDFEILGIYIKFSGRSIFSNKYVSSKLNSYKNH